MESVYVPDYYLKFHCIADQCPHTCCAGWEIDIDQDSAEMYRSLQGETADLLRKNMVKNGETVSFLLDRNDRCPMLTENNLCRLILEYGESSLCQICRDHPRYRTFYTGRTEMGIGMVCPEAGRLILTRPGPMRLVLLSGTGKEKLPVAEKRILETRDILLKACNESGPAERLWEYLVFRHVSPAAEDGRLVQRIGFVRRAYRRLLSQWTDGSIDTLAELCRTFSDRVEYDSEALELAINGGKV